MVEFYWVLLDLGTVLCFGNHYPSLYWLEKQDRPHEEVRVQSVSVRR